VYMPFELVGILHKFHCDHASSCGSYAFVCVYIYIDSHLYGIAENDDGRESNAIILSEEHEHALQLHSTSSLAVASSGRANMGARSSSEYLALRSYQGLEIHTSKVASSKADSTEEDVVPASHEVVEGRIGRAAGYWNEAPNL
jgi:hypothetical protein